MTEEPSDALIALCAARNLVQEYVMPSWQMIEAGVREIERLREEVMCHARTASDYELIVAKQSQEIERLREALQNIMAHQEMVGGTAAHLGGAFAIAKQALVEEGKR